MQQYMTLEEAAKYLQMSPDELREMARKKTVRAFQDRGSWRFRSQDVEELARSRGLGSDAQLQLSEAPKSGKKPPDSGPLPADFALDDDEVPIGKEKPSGSGSRSGIGKSGSRSPKPGSDSDVRLVLEGGPEIMLEADSKVKLDAGGPGSSKRRKEKPGSDSDVRLVPPGQKGTDSDVKLEPSGKDSGAKKSKSPSDSDIRLQDASGSDKKKGDAVTITEEIDLDAEAARLAEKQKTGPRKGKQTQMAGTGGLPTQSPFELSENDINLGAPKKGSKPGTKPGDKKKSDVDSSSDFELIAFDSSKSPIELGSGEIPLLQGDEEVSLGSEVSGRNAGNSGINLKDPADSGISLEDASDAQIDFELSAEETTPKPSRKPVEKKKPAPKADDSSDEFELSLDDSSPQDVSSSEFELSLDADSETDSSSEFELSLEEGSASDSESSDSEFELTLDDEGDLAVDEDAGDIFEETNFDVPALDDSGSEAVALDGDTDMDGSDFEISLDDSSSGERSDSQVVALDDEDADDAAATIAKPRKTGAKGAARGLAGSAVEEMEDLDEPTTRKAKKKAAVVDEDEEDESEEEMAAAAAPAEWPGWVSFPLALTVLGLFFSGIMGFEMVRGMWGYHRPAVIGKPVIHGVAEMLTGEKLPN